MTVYDLVQLLARYPGDKEIYIQRDGQTRKQTVDVIFEKVQQNGLLEGKLCIRTKWEAEDPVT